MRISILDSGEFADDNTGRRSSPRLESVVRDAVIAERAEIASISHIPSPPGDPLRGEPKELHEIRTKDRWKIEQDRVCKTAKQIFQVMLEHNFSTDADLVLIVMRPSDVRSDLVRRSVKRGKRVIIFPPYFTDVNELCSLRKDLSASEENRVVLWLPYRYSVATQAIRKHFHKSEIAAMELSISCAPYLHCLLMKEWSLPFLDVMRLIGGAFDKVEITRTIASGLPVFHLKSIHRNDSNYVLASSLISTAGTLQNTEAARLRVSSTQMESIETTGTFTGFIKRTNHLHQFTDVSHDPTKSTLTGYRALLQCCLDNKWDDDDVKPTLASFSQMQRVLDLFKRLQENAALINVPITESITFKGRRELACHAK